MERVNIYCPKCWKERKKLKKLLEVDIKSSGIIYPYCKMCKENVMVDLDRKHKI